MNIRKIIYKFGVKIRNNFIFVYYDELMKTDKSCIEDLEDLQNKRLKKLLHIAKNESEYYKNILKNIDIENFTLKDLNTIPIMDKDNLRNNIDLIQTYKNYEDAFMSETSGTTGNAFIFRRNKEWDASARAAQLRGYSWYNISPWDKNLYFWGFDPSFIQLLKIRFFDFLLNRYRIFSFSEKELLKAKKVLSKSTYIEGYSSTIYNLSKYLNENNHNYNNIALVKGTSEKIYEPYKPIIKKVFNQKFTSEYGSAESGIIAFECPHSNMHITMENIIVEEIDEKIVITNLFSYSLPIIRYQLGDYIKLDKMTKCACGRSHYIIGEVTGRIGKDILGYKSFYPSLTLYYIFKNIALSYNIKLAYFAKQYIKGELNIEVIRDNTFDESKVQKYILNESKKYFGDDMKIKINFIEKVESINKKTKDFESYIND